VFPQSNILRNLKSNTKNYHNLSNSFIRRDKKKKKCHVHLILQYKKIINEDLALPSVSNLLVNL
jgi:hypothetical protein